MRCFPVACIAILLAGKLQSFANIECASLPLQCAFGFQPVLNDLVGFRAAVTARSQPDHSGRSEEHTSELQALMRISYAVFCLQKQKELLRLQHINRACLTY